MAMVELLPNAVITILKNKLSSVAFRELGDLYNITDKMEKLVSTIKLIETELKDVDVHKTGIQDWIKKVKGAFHAADNLFDDIATENLQLKSQHGLTSKVHSFFSCINGIVFPSRIYRELEKIQNNFDALCKDLKLFQLKPRSSESDSDRRRLTESYASDSDIQGRDEDRRAILKMLVEPEESHGNENVSLIGIVGVGGIGKTAVAKLVYCSEQVNKFFDVRIWVYVSENFDVESIIKKIVESLFFHRVKQYPFIDVLDMLKRYLTHRKYLLVLDDVWNESSEKWTQLMTHLMCGAPGSKILVTTRSRIVAKITGVNNLYYLQALNPDDSWSLFMKFAFHNDNFEMSDVMESLARQMITKCRGVPLLIKSWACLLFFKDESEWLEISEAYFLKQDYGNGIMEDLQLSFQHLSSELIQCFVHCLVYPNGWEIEKKELIQLWMAQGYLEGFDYEHQMEDVGYKFVSTLLGNSFFQQDEFLDSDNKDSFKIHGLMYDFALVVAGNDYSLDSERANTPLHMCLSQESNDINLLGSLDASKVRTFFLRQENDREIAQITGDLSFILRFKRLRVLNLSYSSLKKLPCLIGKLKSLRYLDLSWCVELVSLPKSIGNLVNLQTLKLTGCEKLEFSTKIVTKLISLRHLEIHRCKAFEDMMPAGLGKLSSLQSLSNFNVVNHEKKKKNNNNKAGKLNDLQNLNSLRGNLEINKLDQVKDVKLESQDVNLLGKKLIVSLDLNWENQDKTQDSLQLLENLRPHQDLKRLQVRCYPGDMFSNWLSEINHLSFISLFGFDNCESLPPLENLPYLKSLEISSMKVLEYIYLEEVFHTAATFFPLLERLKFSGCKNFKGWKRMEGPVSVDKISLPPFRRLSQLIINKCPKLTDLPTFPNVEEIQLCESMVKPLKETLDMASSSSSSTPLSMLKSLMIEGKRLDISVLPSQWKQNLTSLERLEIGDVDNLDIWFEDNFTSLQKVVVYGCDLKALPSKMCDLLSLQHIKMMGCHNLASLPKEMFKLTNLVTLEIWDCPLLVERYQSETGVDWPQISHVKNIILKENLRQ